MLELGILLFHDDSFAVGFDFFDLSLVYLILLLLPRSNSLARILFLNVAILAALGSYELSIFPLNGAPS